MATPRARPGEVIDLHAALDPTDEGDSSTLVRMEHVEIFRLALPAGKALPEHRVASFLTLQCLAGQVEVSAHGRRQVMGPGTLMFVAGGEPHAVRSLEDASILVTMTVPRP